MVSCLRFCLYMLICFLDIRMNTYVICGQVKHGPSTGIEVDIKPNLNVAHKNHNNGITISTSLKFANTHALMDGQRPPFISLTKKIFSLWSKFATHICNAKWIIAVLVVLHQQTACPLKVYVTYVRIDEIHNFWLHVNLSREKNRVTRREIRLFNDTLFGQKLYTLA